MRATYRFFIGLRSRIRIRLRQREREFRVRVRRILGGSDGYHGNRHICTRAQQANTAKTNCARMLAQANNECTITCRVRRHGLEKPPDLQLHTSATSKHNKHKLCTHARAGKQITIAQSLAAFAGMDWRNRRTCNCTRAQQANTTNTNCARMHAQANNDCTITCQTISSFSSYYFSGATAKPPDSSTHLRV